MKKIPISELKPGIAFSKPVYLDPENILVKANEPISSSDIERLQKWNINEVETSGEIIEAPEEKPIQSPVESDNPEELADVERVTAAIKKTFKSRNKTLTLFRETEEVVKEAYFNIFTEKPFQLSRIRTLAENLSALLDSSPACFIFTYYEHEGSSLYRHVLRASIFGGLLANALNFSKPRVIELIFSILLMKVGMLTIPETIRNKKGKLTDDERTLLHTHPVKGYQMLTQQAKVKNSIAIVTLQHQEHYDGSGYPRQIKGAEMSEYTRIAVIADSFAALLEPKSYRASKLPYEAMKELVTLGVYRYDPIYLKAFLDTLSIYPLGSIVELSDGSRGAVIGSVPGKPMRPILLLLKQSNGETLTSPQLLHLLFHTDKYISSAVEPVKAGIDFETDLGVLIQQL